MSLKRMGPTAKTRLLAMVLIAGGIAAGMYMRSSTHPLSISFGGLTAPLALWLIIGGILLLLWNRPLTRDTIAQLSKSIRDAVSGRSSSLTEGYRTSILDPNTKRAIIDSGYLQRRYFLLSILIVAVVMTVGFWLFYTAIQKRIDLAQAESLIRPLSKDVERLIDEDVLSSALHEKYRFIKDDVEFLRGKVDLFKQLPYWEEILTIFDSCCSKRTVDPHGLNAAVNHFWDLDGELDTSVQDYEYHNRWSYVRSNVLKGRILQQLSRNVYSDSLPRAKNYFARAMSVDPQCVAASQGFSTAGLLLLKKRYGEINREYLTELAGFRSSLATLLTREDKGNFQTARLLNNSCDMMLDLFNKYLYGGVTMDFDDSKPLLELYNMVHSKPVATLRNLRESLDSAISLWPGLPYPYVTRAQFFATYASCVAHHPSVRRVSKIKLSSQVFGGWEGMDFEAALDNVVDGIRLAAVLGFSEFELMDTVLNKSGVSNLEEAYLGIVRDSSKIHFAELLRISELRGNTWANCRRLTLAGME